MTAPTHWHDVYETQMDTWSFWNSEFGADYGRSFAQDMKEKGRIGADLMRGIADIEKYKLLTADPIYVDSDMMKLWQEATKSFKPENLRMSDLLCPAGFVLLPEPEYMTDVHDKTISFRAFAWMATIFKPNGEDGEGVPGIHLSIYNHKDDEDDYNEEFRTLYGMLDEGRQMLRYPLSMVAAQPWGFTTDPSEFINDPFATDQNLSDDQKRNAAVGGYDMWRKIQAMFRLMQQKISVSTEMAVPRPTRRRALRRGFEERAVTVITLRRPKKQSSCESQDVQYSHRWLVGSHWRNQWFPSIQSHRQIFIAPYIKGPEDKELRIREKRAFQLVR